MKKIYLLFFLCCFFFINPVFAENFVIKNYDVKINVNKNNVLNIEETIDTNFHKRSHGIFRTIPTINKIVRADGTKETKKAKVYNVKMNNHYSTFYQNGNIDYRIGDANKYVIGDKTYVLKYDYQLSSDTLKNIDEFYFNIIGTKWTTDIENVTFTITMPKEFDADKVGFSVGTYGTAGHEQRMYHSIEGNVIKGQTLTKLNPYEGITIRMELPDGYFDKNFIDFKLLFLGLFCIIATIINYFIWFKYGKDCKVIPVVNFRAPAKINSAEAGVIYDLAADNKDLASLVVYLAHKGYIHINSLHSVDFELTLLKEYPKTGGNEIEREFIKALFPLTNKITSQELKVSETFYRNISNLKDKLNRYKQKTFTKKSTDFNTLAFPIFSTLGMIWIIILSLLGFPPVNQLFIEDNLKIIFQCGFSLFWFFMFGLTIKTLIKNNIISIIIILVIFSQFFQVILGFAFFNNISFLENILIMGLAIICVVISCICIAQMPKRNAESRYILGQLLGLKKFIEVAKKKEIQLMVEKNPNAFFDILPFAYVLGVEDKWIKKFETILPANPAWYTGDLHYLNNCLYYTTKYSAPSYANGGISKSSSSSGFSSRGGGGFSGGGFGGGGGRSW